jgi:hypothetical protein
MVSSLGNRVMPVGAEKFAKALEIFDFYLDGRINM